MGVSRFDTSCSALNVVSLASKQKRTCEDDYQRDDDYYNQPFSISHVARFLQRGVLCRVSVLWPYPVSWRRPAGFHLSRRREQLAVLVSTPQRRGVVPGETVLVDGPAT